MPDTEINESLLLSKSFSLVGGQTQKQIRTAQGSNLR